MLTHQQQQFATPFDVHNPLTVGFMSQGQMGYMPQQQYLTPSEYGAFRTLPTNNISNMHIQRPGILQNMAYANAGYFGGIPIPTYNPAVNMLQRQEMARRGIQDQATSWAGTAMDALPLGLSMLHPALAVASLVAPRFGANMVDIHAQMRETQNMSMPKITFGSDVSKSLGMGFSGSSALSIEKFIRKSAAGDAFLKTDDYRAIMQKGMEHSMFDYSNDAQAYKKVIKRLRNQTDVMLEVVDDKNLDGVMKNLKRLQDMGATGSMAGDVARQEGMFARMTGMRHTDMVNSYGQQGALIYAQQGLTGYQGALSAMGTAAQLTMAQRMGLVSPDLLARNGGLSGFTQRITEEGAAGIRKGADMFLPYLATNDFKGIDSDKLKAFMSGNLDIFSTMASGANKAGANVSDFSSFLTNKDQLIKDLTDKLGSLGTVLMQLVVAQQTGKAMGIQGTSEQVSRGLQQAFGYSPQSARTLTEMYTNKEFMHGMQQQLTRERAMYEAKGAEQSKDKAFWSWKTGALSFVQDLAAPFYDWKGMRETKKDWQGAIDSGIYGGNVSATTDNPLYKLHTSGGYVGGAEKPSVDSIKDLGEGLGAVSELYESSNGTNTIGYDSGGGTSYGNYQISSVHNWDAFIQYVEKHEGENGRIVASVLRKAGPGNTGGKSGRAVKAWKWLVEKGYLTKGMQFRFVKRTLYDPGLKSLNAETRQRVLSSETLQKAFFSASIQHGGGGGAKIYNNAFNKDMTNQEFLIAVQEGRSRRYSGPRVRKELQTLLTMEALESGGIGPEHQRAQDVLDEAFGTYRTPGNTDIELQRVRKRVGKKLDSEPSWAATAAQRGLVAASNMSTSEMEEIIAKMGVSPAEFRGFYRRDMKGVGPRDEGYTGKAYEMLKNMVKAANPDFSSAEVAEAAGKLYLDPQVKRLLLKQLGEDSPEVLETAKTEVKDAEDDRLKAIHEVINDRAAELFEKQVKLLKFSDAEFLAKSNKSTGVAYSLAGVQQKLIAASTMSGSEKEAKLAELHKQLVGTGLITEEEFKELVRSGDITTLKSLGLNADELKRIQQIASKHPDEKEVDFNKFAVDTDHLLKTERTYRGYNQLSVAHNISRKDLLTREGVEKALNSSSHFPPEVEAMLTKLKASSDATIHKGILADDLASALVPGSGPYTAGVGTTTPGDAGAHGTNKITSEFLEGFAGTLAKNGESVGKNTTAIENLTKVLTGEAPGSPEHRKVTQLWGR